MCKYVLPGYNNTIVVMTGFISLFVLGIPLVYYKILPAINYIYYLEITGSNLCNEIIIKHG